MSDSLVNPGAKPPQPALPVHSWAGYPIAHPDHIPSLDQAAAIYEFQHGIPKGQAEARAHADYVRKQRVEAASHHLQGARAAAAAGDMESARNHNAMYELHSKALGFEPASVHPDIVGHMLGNPGKYKFKAHRGDLFAVDHSVTKAEAFNSLYKQLERLSKSVQAPDLKKVAPPGFSEATMHKLKRQHGEEAAFKIAWAAHNKATKKSEMKSSTKKPKAVPCVCQSYHFPHRSGSGKCQATRK